MPTPFTFPPPPPPPPRATSSLGDSQNTAPSNSYTRQNTPGGSVATRGSAFDNNHHSRGSRGQSTSHRGRGNGSQRGGNWTRGQRGGQNNQSHGHPRSQHQHAPSAYHDETAARNSAGYAVDSTSHEQTAQNNDNHAGSAHMMPPHLQQQFAEYTAAAQMLWNSPQFQDSFKKAQENVAAWTQQQPSQTGPVQYQANTQVSSMPQAVPFSQKRPLSSHNSRQQLRGGQFQQQGTRGRGKGRNKPQERAKVQAAPPVPSFGFTLPAPPSSPPLASASKPRKHLKNNKRRKTEHLGLIPGEVTHYSSEAEEELEVDEEAQWADFKGPITVEHNGRVSTLGSAKEIAAWTAERKRQFPTKARIEQKKKDLVEKRDRLVRLQKEHVKAEDAINTTSTAKQEPNTDPLKTSHGIESELAKHQQEIALLRQKLLESEERYKIASSQMTPEDSSSSVWTPSGNSHKTQNDANATDLKVGEFEGGPVMHRGPNAKLQLNYATNSSEADSEEDINDVSESEAESSSVVSSSSESSDVDSDSDEAPDVQSIRTSQPVFVPAPKRDAPRRVCHDFKRSGRCSRGDKCRFEHPPRPQSRPLREPEKRMTLLERFKLEEKKEENKLALEAIKWLGDKGFLE